MINMSTELQKPIIGFSSGDLNGIGLEIIIKTLSDNRILDMCMPVVFASSKSINFYKKTLADANLNVQVIKEFARLPGKQVACFSCWEEDVQITPGQLNETGGKYAWRSLVMAAQALKENRIQGLVTAPIHKNNSQSVEFNFTGHTPYLKSLYEVTDVVMLMVADEFR